MSEEKTAEQKVTESNDRFLKIYEGLSAPFPKEALSEDKSRGFALTSIKAQYIVERLNQVCGVAGWALTGDYNNTEDGVIFFGTLTINDGFKAHAQQGAGFSAKKKNSGDMYKGAQTDALSKIASKFGLGNDVFKGKVAPPKSSAPVKKKVSTPDF